MSIEEHFANELKSKKHRHFKDMAGKLLLEKESEDTRLWKWEEEITESDWNGILSALAILRREGLINKETNQTWRNFVELAAYAHLFDSKRNLNIDANVMRIIERLRKSDEEFHTLQTTAFMHLIDPSIEYQISKDIIKESDDLVGWRSNNNLPSLIGQDQLALKILIPSHVIKIPASVWNMDEWKESENISGFANVFARNRLVDPPPQISISESWWEKMKTELDELRNNKLWFPFCKLAFHMRVLAAHKVEITEKGIEFIDTPSTKLDVVLPPRPLRKKK